MSNEYETFDSTFIRSDFIVCNQHHFWGSFMSNSGRGGFRPGAGRKSGWSDRGERGGGQQQERSTKPFPLLQPQMK